MGTVRTMSAENRDLAEKRVAEIAEGIAAGFGAKAEVHYKRNYPVMVNHEEQTAFAAEVAGEIAPVRTDMAPTMGAEDFAYMLEKVPGAYLFVGNGDTALLHHPQYDFDDAAAPFGASFLARVAERALGA